MAEIYQKRKNYHQAREYLNEALKLAIEIEDKPQQGFILRNLGTLNQNLGADSEALNYLHQALEIGIETKDVQIIWEAQAGLGSCYEKQGKSQEAITHYINAIAVYDSVRNSLDIESLRNNFLEDKYEAYPSIIQLLAESGKFSDAFTYAEQYKAKTILDILSQGRNLFSELLSDTLKAQLQQITSQHESPILFYLPFEMLVFDTTGVESPYDFENAKFLLEKFDVSYVSSASLLDPGLQTLRKPDKGILAMGNPDFGPQPDEPEQGELLASKEPITGSRVIVESLLPLPNSETEVKAIGGVLRGLNNNILTGNRATEENFKSNAPDYRILHLATHFLTNDYQPLYSKIALAQNGDAEEDGFLQTYEVFNMNLNADWVVLSACNTALGKLRKGEGVIGISRAFLFAGVPSMVVSLWNVDDKATAIIMRDFYKYMKAGFNKKHALRRAKVDYLKASGAGPYYWAPFILIGDWQPLDLPTRPALNTWLIGIVTFLVIATTLIIRKRRSLFS